VAVLSVTRKSPQRACPRRASRLADLLATTFVLVVGRDVADAGVQPHGVVVVAADVKLGAQHGGAAIASK
jgi:hypothetical protein